MGLTKAEIDALLQAEANKPKRGGGGPRKPKGPDTSIRDYRTWFKLATAMIDEAGEPRLCENPECSDNRDHTKHIQICAQVNGKFMCRYCFMDGWNTINEDQMELAAENG